MAVKDSSEDGPSPSVGLTTATARTLLAPLEGTGGRAELVARRLGDAIRFGLVLDGERLPAEAQLAAQLGVSTVTLREALTMLRAQGLITTRRGRGGGSFVRVPADLGEPLLRFSVQELRDLGDQRGAIAGAAARLAAERAVPEEIRRLEEQVERLAGAGSASERRRADTELTIAIAGAAQSPRLTREEAQLRAEVGDLLGFDDHAALVRGRRRLVTAIAGRRPDVARKAAERHVAAETEGLIRLRLSLREAADQALEAVAAELEGVLGELDALGAQFAALVGSGRVRREDLADVRPAIFALLSAHGELVTGAGIVTAPGLLSDAPLWLEWWWTDGRGGAPEALRVNLDPAAPDFYDYTGLDWYATPVRALAPRMAGPYVDYACTNQYAITFSAPVIADGAILGVAAADVLVTSLERRVLPALGRPAALVNADGRVIVSSSPAVRPGQRLDVSGAAVVSPVPSWRVVDLP
ncbi:MAG TPA: GntR family transcriptional regulator [Solirubrobacter sp.]|nr:GntR family transcriptional regulator [Solirubrobacter sp.]